MHYEVKDKYYLKAKKENYPSRSAYKLLEMEKQFRVFRPKMKIVDLGSAPGGWLKVLENKDGGLSLVGIDLLPLKFQPKLDTHFIQGDFLEEENQKQILKILGGGVHWVLSDMSPNLTGIKFKDSAASIHLCESALEFSKRILKPGGGLLVKAFPGPEFSGFKKNLKANFKEVHQFIPTATRKTSDEVYLVGVKLM